MSDEWGPSPFPSLLRSHFFYLAVKTWLSACVSATYYASQRNQEPGWKRPNVHYEADFQMKHGAYCCEDMMADPAARSEAEVDDRPTAVQGLLPGQQGRDAGEMGLEVTASSSQLGFIFFRRNIPVFFSCCCGLISCTNKFNTAGLFSGPAASWYGSVCIHSVKLPYSPKPTATSMPPVGDGSCFVPRNSLGHR